MVEDFPKALTENIENKLSNKTSNSKFAIALFLILLVSTVFFGTWYFLNNYFSATVPILASDYKLSRLSESGKVFQAAISPDGKLIAYTNRVGNKESIWLRQLEIGVNTELLEPIDEFHYGINFSADGKTIFFTRKKMNAPLHLYSVSILGGVAQKIIENTEGKIAVSNDGAKIAFTRYEPGVKDKNALWIADIDGKNPRLIRESEPQNAFYYAIVFSPDNKKVAISKGNSNNASQEMSLVEIDVQSGQLSELSEKRFFNIVSVNWLPSYNELLISAGEKINEAAMIWKIDYTSGKTILLRDDSISFSNLDMDSNASKMTGTAVSPDFHLFTAGINNAKDLTELSQARDGFSFTSDGKIVFASDLAGPEDIWIMNRDGSNKKQLTTHKGLDAYPLVSEDNQHIYFTSNRTGKMQIWRMNLDGTEQIQITKNSGGFSMRATADGKKLYYQNSEDLGIWELSLENFEQKQILEKKSRIFAAFSPNAEKLAFVAQNKETGNYQINVLKISSGKIIQTFPLEKFRAYSLNWLKNEEAITYLTDEDFDKTSFWRQNLSEQSHEKITVFSNNQVNYCQFLPQNEAFAVILGNWKHDAYLIEGLK